MAPGPICRIVQVFDVLASATESVGSLVSGLEPGLYSGDDAARAVDAFARLERIAAAGKTLMAGRVDECSTWKASGDRSAAHWLAKRTGTTVREAKDVVDTAKRVASLPRTSAAMRAGDLSSSEAAVVSAAATVNPHAEESLLNDAALLPLDGLRRKALEATRPSTVEDDRERARRQHRDRRLRWWTDEDGMGNVAARLAPDVFALFLAALQPFADAAFKRAHKEGRHESSEAYAADGLADMARAASGLDVDADADADDAVGVDVDVDVDVDVENEGDLVDESNGAVDSDDPADDVDQANDLVPDSVNVRADNAEGVAPNADDATGSSVEGGAGPNRPTRRATARRSAKGRGAKKRRRRYHGTKIIVRIDHAALMRGAAEGEEVCEIAGIGAIPVSTVRRMIEEGDPFLAGVVTKGIDVLSVVHLGRRATAAQLTALQWRDPECCVEDCTRSAYIQIDHREGWTFTHTTSLDDLDRLCKPHHDKKTYEGWTLAPGTGKRAFNPPERPPPDAAARKRRYAAKPRHSPATTTAPRDAKSSGSAQPEPRSTLFGDAA